MALTRLANEFAPVTFETWRERVVETLEGNDLSALTGRTPEGIALQPLYPPAPASASQPVAARAPGHAWDIVASADHTDAKAGNRQVLEDLRGGASGLSIAFAHAPSAGGFGLPPDRDTLRTLLQDVYLDLIHLRVEPHPLARHSAHWLAELFEQRSTEPTRGSVSFGLDPVGQFARWGMLGVEPASLGQRLAGTVEMLKGKGFAGRFVEADGRAWHAAGASDVQELASVLATAVHYLRILTAEGGHTPDEAFAAIGVSLAVDRHQLASIAKLRAMRRLWRRLQELCGAKDAELRLHAETARRMMMADDPHTNLLRTTLAGFAAGVGGADSITILPFTCALGLADGTARRMARNLHHLMLEESNLHRVADPSAGSGAVEALTDEMCETAWSDFQAIEAEGGILESLAAGVLQDRIAQARQALLDAVADGSETFVGATIFPNASPAKIAVLEAEPWPAPEFAEVVARCNPIEPVSLAEGQN
ncbi:MAG TPA: methylmalonyl-CoA mutase family protein [Afifellaceae bacterium]|nr:methylmalonyl-CoA mutase family protein [Afifellaceae bacterium]